MVLPKVGWLIVCPDQNNNSGAATDGINALQVYYTYTI